MYYKMLENIPISKLRVFNNVFNGREKREVLDEALYAKHKVYPSLTIEKLVELSINKKIKEKIYKIHFRNNSENIKRNRLEILEEYYRDL